MLKKINYINHYILNQKYLIINCLTYHIIIVKIHFIQNALFKPIKNANKKKKKTKIINKYKDYNH